MCVGRLKHEVFQSAHIIGIILAQTRERSSQKLASELCRQLFLAFFGCKTPFFSVFLLFLRNNSYGAVIFQLPTIGRRLYACTKPKNVLKYQGGEGSTLLRRLIEHSLCFSTRAHTSQIHFEIALAQRRSRARCKSLFLLQKKEETEVSPCSSEFSQLNLLCVAEVSNQSLDCFFGRTLKT